jgi:hypothetical protein
MPPLEYVPVAASEKFAAPIPPALKKVKVDADKATSVPPPYCASAKLPAVLIVTPAPAVMVVVPAPLLAMKMVSPVVNTLLLTVIVVEPALFMITRLPASPTTST